MSPATVASSVMRRAGNEQHLFRGSAPARSARTLLWSLRLPDLDPWLLVQVLVAYERDPHAPSAERADHLAELAQREVAVIDRYERLVQIGLQRRVSQDHGAKDVTAGNPLTALLEPLDLRLTGRDLSQREPLRADELVRSCNVAFQYASNSASPMAASFSAPTFHDVEATRGSAYSISAESPLRVILTSSGDAT
jgi:hypothetical protein